MNMSERPEVKAVQANATAINSTIVASSSSIQWYAQKLAEEGFIDATNMFTPGEDCTDGVDIPDIDGLNKLTEAVVATLKTTTIPEVKFMLFISVIGETRSGSRTPGETAEQLVNQITKDYGKYNIQAVTGIYPFSDA